jgi:tripartite-type tricarboxylate transporter receptor subunit TctC
MRQFRVAGALAAAGMAMGVGHATADAVEDFYKTKQMTMLIGLSTGGGYDRYARLTARHLQKYIPGNPNIVAKNMTGGGSLVMANFLYNVAPQDGSVIGAPQRGVPVEPLVAGKDSKAKLEPLKMQWIGSLNRETSIAVAWHASGVKSYKDLLEREFIAGGTGATTDSVITGYVMRKLLGMQYRMIAGYPGGSEVNLAMQRGEVMGRATNSWSSIQSGNFNLVKEGKLILLYQMGAKPNPDPLLKDVPFALDFAKDERTRKILFLKFGVNEFGYPYVMGPGVPKDRVAAIRAAFRKASQDPELLAQARRARMGVNPIYGEEIEELLKEMYGTPPDIVAALREASKPTGKVEMAKIPVITAKVKLGKIQGEGKRVAFKGKASDGADVKGRVGVSGSKTEITVGGQTAKRAALKSGMTCTLVYQGRDAQKIACE